MNTSSNTTSNQLQLQFLPIEPYSSLGPLPSSVRTFQYSGTLQQGSKVPSQ